MNKRVCINTLKSKVESPYQLDYKQLAKGSNDEEDRHSAIMSSFSSKSNKDSEALVNMANLPKEVSKRLEKKNNDSNNKKSPLRK